MTISSDLSVVRYNGNASTKVFPYTYKITDEDQLVVVVADENGVESTKVLNVDYTVSGVLSESGGNVTYPITGDPLPTGHKIAIARSVELVQETDFENQGGFFASTHEDSFDKATMQLQQLQEQIDRAPKVSITSGSTGDEYLTEIQGYVANAAASAADAQSSEDDAETAQLAAEAAQSAAETAESNINTTVANLLASVDVLQFVERSDTPATPSAGNLKFYAKNDKKPYYLDEDAIEHGFGGGGGSALSWHIGDDDAAPEKGFLNNVDTYAFATGGGEYLYAEYKVPENYSPGEDIEVTIPIMINSTASTKKMNMQITATLIRIGTDAVTSTTNQSVTAVEHNVLGTSKIPIKYSFAITSSGKINSVAIDKHLILLKLERIAASSNDATQDALLLANGNTVKIGA